MKMSSTNNVTFNMIAADMYREDEKVELEYSGINKTTRIDVVKTLDFISAMRFVRDIVASCANADTGEFTPEGFDFAVRVNALVFYAGFDVPEDMPIAYDVVYKTNLFDMVMANIDKRQFDVLVKAAMEQIEYTRQMFISAQAARVTELINKMDEVMEDGNDVMKMLSSGDFKTKIDEMMSVIGAAGRENFAGGNASQNSNIVALPVMGNA